MSRRKIIESEKYRAEDLDLRNWPIVLIDNLDAQDRITYLKRKKAVEMYLNDQPIKLIRDETGIDFESLRRLVLRCIDNRDTFGNILGYRGLIPNKTLKTYTRKSKEISNHAGMFSLLLETHPQLAETIKKFHFQSSKGMVSDPKMKPKYIHKRFLEKCREIGITENQYPFNTETLAKRSLERYLHKLNQDNFTRAAGRYGDDSSMLATNTGIGSEHNLSILRPLERVQFDGHRIDGIFTITFQTPEGDVITRVLERLWLLVILDVPSRSVIGYHLSANLEYTAADVVHCIRNAVVPKVKRKLTIPGLSYNPRGGFPSESISEMQWALWDEMLYDNGKANLSKFVSDRLEKIIKCSTNAGPVAVPVRRGYIERFFGVLEECGYHRMINTTGINPQDPRRNNAEAKAIQYSISFEHLEEITDVLISDYNGTVNEGINNMTPLEVLRQRIHRGLLPRVMPEEERGEVVFLSMLITRKVNGSIKEGRRPFINFEGVDYRSDVLSRSPDLIGTKLNILVNIDDIRVLRAFLPDGSEFGTLTGSGKWGVVPHSMQTRKEINRLRKRKLLHFTTEDNPIDCYHRFLETQSISKKSSRNKLVEERRRSNSNEEKYQPNVKENSVSIEELETTKPITRISKNLKTINY